MKETMTVHKALSELKVLDARIHKELGEVKFVVNNKHNNAKIDGKNIADFCASMKEKYQSLRTLINRRNAIKAAVTMSNATTSVNICGKSYTVAEAIDMKSVGIGYMKEILDKLETQYRAATKFAEKENGSAMESRADNYMATMYSSTDLKNMSDEIKKVREAFIASQSVDIVETVNATKEMDSLRNTVDTFVSEVDSALSVSNALTTIEVEYDTY